MATWYTSAAPAQLRAGNPATDAVSITVKANGGTVLIQAQDNTGAWFTPAAAEYTISEDSVVTLDRANAPAAQIVATGAATFSITDNS